MRYPEVFFRTLVMPIAATLVVLGFHFFLRGHNAPGGGFIAGLIVAVAALLIRMAAEQGLLNLRPRGLIPVGLLIALVTGIAPMALGHEFLRSWHGYVQLPILGQVELSTALLFDLGVFLVVVGVTVTIIDLLADDSELARLGLDQEQPTAAEEAEAEGALLDGQERA